MANLPTPEDYGAIGDNITDDTLAVETLFANHEAVMLVNNYKTTRPIAVGHHLNVHGFDRNYYGSKASIHNSSGTTDTIQVATDQPVNFSGVNLYAPSGASAGAIVRLDGNTSQNMMSTFRDVQFNGGFDNVRNVSAADFTMDNCVHLDFAGDAVTVQNTHAPDGGDSRITGAMFSTTRAGSRAIKQTNAGGLRVLDNKFIGACAAYDLVFDTTGADTTDLFFIGNSIECTGGGVALNATGSGAHTFGHVVMSANQIAGPNNPFSFGGDLPWLHDVVLTGNIVRVNPNQTGMFIGNSVQGYMIGNNVLSGYNNTGNGLVIMGNATGQLGINQYSKLAVDVNTATPFKSYMPPPIVMGKSAVPVAASGVTETILATIPIGGLMIGVNGTTRISAAFSCTNASSKTLRVKFGGVTIGTATATSGGYVLDITLSNQSMVNAQLNICQVNGAVAGITGSSVNTANDQNIAITGQKTAAGDTLNLVRYLVELFQG